MGEVTREGSRLTGFREVIVGFFFRSSATCWSDRPRFFAMMGFETQLCTSAVCSLGGARGVPVYVLLRGEGSVQPWEGSRRVLGYV